MRSLRRVEKRPKDKTPDLTTFGGQAEVEEPAKEPSVS